MPLFQETSDIHAHHTRGDNLIDVLKMPQLQWEFQDLKMEVVCHIKRKFIRIFPCIGLLVGTSHLGS